MKKLGIIVQARMGSTRLPGKVLKEVLGKSLLEYLFERLARVKTENRVVLATTTNTRDNELVDQAKKLGIPFFCGSEDDVLDRYYQVALEYGFDPIIRITADCPLILPALIDNACEQFLVQNKPDYLGYKLPYPEGLADIAIFPFASLKVAWKEAKEPSEREHVTKFLINRPERFRLVRLEINSPINDLRYTVDEDLDYKVVKKIIEDLYPNNKNITLKDLEEYSAQNIEVVSQNKDIMRNEGYQTSLYKDKQKGY